MKPIFAVFIFITIALTTLSAHAEYRVFDLVISNATTGESREELSTLDNIQYPTYYPLRSGESIQIKDTWRCHERAEGFTPYCANPRAPASATNP